MNGIISLGLEDPLKETFICLCEIGLAKELLIGVRILCFHSFYIFLHSDGISSIRDPSGLL